MLKFFKDLSFIGGVLFLSTLFLGLVFRIIGLHDISAWGDEVASWYYARHLSEVFFGESHTPVYYFLCKIWYWIFPATILSLRYFTIVLSLIVVALTCAWVGKKKDPRTGLVLFVLWWLWPSMVIYARQARHYSLYLDLSILVLVMWEFRKDLNKYVFWSVLAFYQSIHPLAALAVSFLAAWDFFKNKDWKEAFFKLSSVLPVALYYLARLVYLGGSKVHSNIAWISQSPVGFVKSMIALFFGDSFPFSKFYPVQNIGMILITVVIFGIVVFRNRIRELWRSESFRKFFLIFAFTELTVELLGLLNFNLRISRYFIYVPGFLVFAIVECSNLWAPREKLIKASLFALCLAGYGLIYHQPWNYYSWDDQNIAAFKLDMESLPKKDVIICGSAFQLEYYFQRPYRSCSELALSLHRFKKPFYFFDINGNDKMTLIFLHNESRISLYKKYEHAVLVSVEPK